MPVQWIDRSRHVANSNVTDRFSDSPFELHNAHYPPAPRPKWARKEIIGSTDYPVFFP